MDSKIWMSNTRIRFYKSQTRDESDVLKYIPPLHQWVNSGSIVSPKLTSKLNF